MLQGKELILATKPFAKENRALSWYHTLSTLLLLIACFAGTLLLPWLYVRLGLSIFTGFVLVRMFVIYHDFEHKSILKDSPAGKIIFGIFGIFILAPGTIWRRSHDYHHANNSKLYTANIGSFPIMTRQRYMSAGTAERNMYLFIRHPLTIMAGYIFVFIYGFCIKSLMSSFRRHFDSLIAMLFHGAAYFYLIHYYGWSQALMTITIPFSIACFIGAYLFYAQHNFPDAEFREKEGWTYEMAALESSSYMIMNPFMRWASANIGYHHIHHLNARIPFYRLPEVMASIPELQNPKTTTLSIKDMFACFRLKVWDADKGKMIPLS